MEAPLSWREGGKSAPVDATRPCRSARAAKAARGARPERRGGAEAAAESLLLLLLVLELLDARAWLRMVATDGIVARARGFLCSC